MIYVLVKNTRRETSLLNYFFLLGYKQQRINVNANGDPSIHFLFPLVPELRVMGVSCSLSQLSLSEGGVTPCLAAPCMAEANNWWMNVRVNGGLTDHKALSGAVEMLGALCKCSPFTILTNGTCCQ